MTDKPDKLDTSRKIVINSLFNSIMASALMTIDREYTAERQRKDIRERLERLGHQISPLLDERDAAIARAEKAETALEAAHIAAYLPPEPKVIGSVWKILVHSFEGVVYPSMHIFKTKENATIALLDWKNNPEFRQDLIANFITYDDGTVKVEVEKVK